MIILLLSLCLAGGPDSAISSENLDVYKVSVQRARKSCGPVALWYCLKSLGHDVAVQDVVDRTDVGEEGTSLSNLLEVSASFGLPGRAVHGDRAHLTALPTPAILIVDSTHCVVLEGTDAVGLLAHIFEPTLAHRKSVPLKELQQGWSGTAILFSDPPLSSWGFGAVVCLTALTVIGMSALLMKIARKLRQPAGTETSAKRGQAPIGT